MVSGLRFAVLGPVRAWREDTELDLGTPQQRSVLAVLLLAEGRQVPAGALVDALWGPGPPKAAAGTVRTYISRLRQGLAAAGGQAVIESAGAGYVLPVRPAAVDLSLFVEWTGQARAARSAGDTAQAAVFLRDALGLWKGEPLAGLPGEYAQAQRARLSELQLAAVEDRLALEIELGGHVAAAAELRTLAAAHPLRERLSELLMLALYRAGRQADALAVFGHTRRTLSEELGIDPGPALRDMHQRILQTDQSLIGPAEIDRRPLPARAPAPDHEPRPADPPPGNLPGQVSSFIGRDAELAAVRALVARSQLVTLTGAGGAGKTRLGLQVAAGLADVAADGVWFADLAPLSDPDLVAVTVADVLGVRVEPGRPALDTLAYAVGDRNMLVVLDNCEHVIGACAKLADALLRGCPNLVLLATSREPLGISGEQVYRVPSMRVPPADADAATIRGSEAVRLLEDRAAAQGVTLAWDEPATEVAGRICRRLDGIPLAIELAAARLRVIPAAELEARLDERFALLTGGSRAALPRHQTLRAMVDWSWDLLTGAERAVLARLSVFAGGFGLDAAEAVAAGPDVPAAGLTGLLGGLVDKSLIQFGDAQTGPGRYRLLDTIREYAAGHLDALGPAAADAARIAHRDWYLALAEQAAPQLRAADQAGWLDRLDAELGNLRAAITVSLAQADPVPGLRLAASLGRYWNIRGHAAEGAGVLRALLDAPSAQGATLPRARALRAAAHLLRQTGDYAIAGVYCQQALPIARAAGDERLVADLLHEQARVLQSQGQAGAALPLVESGLGLARRLAEPGLTGRLLIVRSITAHAKGDPAGAVRDTVEALRLSRQAGDQLLIGQLLSNLGNFEMAAGDLDAARRHLAEALDIARALDDRSGLANQSFNLGLAEYLGGSLAAASALFAESLGLATRGGMRPVTAYALVGLAMASRSGADLGWPARLHGAAGQVLADLGESLDPLEARLADLDRERLCAAMGAEAFEAEYAAGRALDAARVLAALGPTDQRRAARLND